MNFAAPNDEKYSRHDLYHEGTRTRAIFSGKGSKVTKGKNFPVLRSVSRFDGFDRPVR